MIKALKELKRQADLKVKGRQNPRDCDGRVIINMNVREDSGFISSFSDTTKPVISDAVADFLVSRAEAVPINERLTLRVYGDCIDEAEREIYKSAISEYFLESYAAGQREFIRNTIAAVVLAVLGVLVLGVMILLESIIQVAVWIEVIDIIAWVFVWEAADIWFLENRVVDLRRKRCLALMYMKIEFYPSLGQSGDAT